MTDTAQSTVTDIRRGLIQAADAHFETARPYGNARRRLEDVQRPEPVDVETAAERYNTAAFTAWCGHMTAANFANVIAAMLRRAAEDHGEEYAARLAEIVAGAEEDGEDAYFANDDLRPLPVLESVPAAAAPDGGNRA